MLQPALIAKHEMELRLQILRLGLKVGQDALQPNVAESLHNKA
jgi:hypothetical protein